MTEQSEQSEQPVQSEQPDTPQETPSVSIITIKINDGEIFAGEFVETRKLYGRDVHVLYVDDLIRWVPVNNCTWWAIGETSAVEARKLKRAEMKEQARQLLLEVQKQTEEVSQEKETEETLIKQTISIEEQVRLRDKVRDQKNAGLGQVVRGIAEHQRSFFEKKGPEKKGPQIPDNRIIQPGEELESSIPAQKTSARSSISRLNDDAEDI
jgi:hypothetical protein